MLVLPAVGVQQLLEFVYFLLLFVDLRDCSEGKGDLDLAQGAGAAQVRDAHVPVNYHERLHIGDQVADLNLAALLVEGLLVQGGHRYPGYADQLVLLPAVPQLQHVGHGPHFWDHVGLDRQHGFVVEEGDALVPVHVCFDQLQRALEFEAQKEVWRYLITTAMSLLEIEAFDAFDV